MKKVFNVIQARTSHQYQLVTDISSYLLFFIILLRPLVWRNLAALTCTRDVTMKVHPQTLHYFVDVNTFLKLIVGIHRLGGGESGK